MSVPDRSAGPPLPRRNRSTTATAVDFFACALCWVVQIVTAAVAFLLSAAGIMMTDPCGPAADCGGSVWIDRAMGLSVLAGFGLLAASLVACTTLLFRQRRAFPAAIDFAVAQGGVFVVAMMMVEQAGVR